MAEEVQMHSGSSSGSDAVSGPIRRVLLISAGASHSVALLLTVGVGWGWGWGWGEGEDGQLGHGDAEDRFSPTQLSALDGQEIVSVTSGLTIQLHIQNRNCKYTAGDDMVFFSNPFLSDGLIFRLYYYSFIIQTFSRGDFGRLGHGNSSDLFTPQPIKALQGLRIKQIACGDSHCLAVTMEGEVQSWGRNQNGQLGLGNMEDSLVPRKIEAFQKMASFMVGAGVDGNLGLGDRDDRLVPEKVSTIQGEKMVLVACGWRHTISVSSSGSLYTYGWSKYGQLGHGDFEDHLIPHKLEALRENRISQISGGWRHTMAVTADGKLYGWGWNKFGQVGVGNNVDHCSPVQVKFPLDQKVVNISCGWRHTLAVTERQNVFSWGRGTNGQLGHGDSVDRNVPKIIEALSMDGSSGQHIEASKVDVSSAEKTWVSPTERYAVVPNENSAELFGPNGNDVNVPESDVKRIKI
ncbi:UNVERIFIED_CONTAM: Ultraviolet-B receptor UVR8 [Sesamum latifolium]|uniref:Ultraviolet-B receptor UVR8 n=1 Tax=Sesamum latifolium TaxID=2727402 RepID=A0AAW2XA89_9LAMI